MADSYVCSGAVMRCSCGTSQAKLTVLPIRTVFLTGQPMANISDHLSFVNLGAFGRCRSLGFPATASATAAAHGKLTPMPCMHNTPFPWMGGKNDYIIKGDPALLKSSTCQCVWGGTISIVNDGQTDTGMADNNREARETEEEMKARTEEKQQLDVDSVLDGIQLALDVAGFVPGLGAIPDLLNASISALRGNWAEAGMSVLAAVPGIGDAAAAAKIAHKGVKAAKTINKTKKITNVTETLSKERKREIAKKYISKEVDKKQLLKEPGVTPNNVDEVYRQVKIERKREAISFYKEHWNAEKPKNKIIKSASNEDFQKALSESKKPINREKILREVKERRKGVVNHINGIDFNHPVEKISVNDGNVFYQFNSGKMGNYLTPDPNVTPAQLGISAISNGVQKGKYEIIFNNMKGNGLPALKSTAKEITDTWSQKIYSSNGHSMSIPIKTTGGGTQVFIPNNPQTWNITTRRIDISIVF